MTPLGVRVLGRGKVGRALHAAWCAGGLDSALIGARAKHHTLEGDVFLLAVPDARIATTAHALDHVLPEDAIVLHLAGARRLDELTDALQRQGRSFGVLHPLVSFAHRSRAPSLAGATFTAFGEARAVRAARKLVAALDARIVVLRDAPSAAYHAAAALLANGAAALAFHASRALRDVGFSERQAEHALAGLLGGVAQNVAMLGVPHALTGPVSRGDADAVLAHVAALRAVDARLAEHYAALQPAIIEAARAQGLPAARAAAIERALKSPGSRRRRAAR